MSSRFRPYLLGLVLAVTTASVTAKPQTPKISPEPGVAPTEDFVLSHAEALRVVADELLLRQSPSLEAPRRGSLRRGAEVWAYQRVNGPDCRGDWLLVGPSAWACDAEGQFDGRSEAWGSPKNEPPTLKFVRVGDSGALGYKSWTKAEQGLPDAELQPGFFVGVVEEKSLDQELYYRTTHGIWLQAAGTAKVTLSRFAGKSFDEPIEPTDALKPYLPVGWVYVDGARGRKTPGGNAIGQKLARLTQVTVLSQQRDRNKRVWFQTDVGWLEERALRVPTVASPPEELRPGERFLDVDTATQTLVAYRQGKPVFATLVSTGKGSEKGPTATPKGVHRFWAKLLWSDMDNLDELRTEEVDSPLARPYNVEAVPWVMYFQRGYGLHATYWHDRFGVPQSHGCVNLSPRDAQRLFDFTSPTLGPGWQAAHPSDYDPATIVRVR